MSLATHSLAGLQASIHARCSSVSSASSASCTTQSTASALATATPPYTPPDAPVPSPVPSAPSTTTTTTTAKPKACYHLVRLNKSEIERRHVAGHCTYCNETGHTRRSCAAGRIMRKVPKRVLDARLRSSVCPLCGDADADGHCKQTCPDKQRLQATLDAKRDSAGLCATTTTTDRAPYGLPRRTSRTLRQARCTSTGSIDLIDLDTHAISSGSSVRSASSRSSASSAHECPSTPPNYRQAYSPKQKQKQNLLDTVVTEVVWGGISLPVAKSGLGLGFAMDMDVDMAMAMDGVVGAELTEDLIVI